MRIYLVTIAFVVVDFFLLNFWLVSPAQSLEAYLGQEVVAVGYIEPLTFKNKDKGKSFLMSCQQLQINGHVYNYKDKLRIHTGADIRNSGKIRVSGKLEELRSFANPGGFNMDNYNWSQGIGGTLVKAQAELVGENRLLDKLALLNLRLRSCVELVTSAKLASLLNGMVLGGNQIEETVRESFSKNGISHLLSVSGTHLLLLASFLQSFLDFIGFRQKNKRSIFVLLFLILYAGICGFKPPVLRALLMSSVLCWGDDSRNAEKGKILCVLSMMMLLFKPVWLLDLGFQLSFSATAGLIWLLPKLKQRLEEYLPECLSSSLAVTLAAQLATLPILVANFYTVSIVAICSNLLLVPVLELATIFTLVGMLLSLIWQFLGGIFIKLAAWLVEQVLIQAELLTLLPFAIIVMGTLPAFCACLYYTVVFSFLDLGPFLLLSKSERKLCIGVCSSIILCCYLWGRFAPIPTTIYFLDVGQGDGAVIITPQRKVIVIDTGGLKSLDTGARIITPFIHSLGLNRVDLFVPSHYDYDHVGGAVGLARNIEIQRLVLPREQPDEEQRNLFQNVLQYVDGKNVWQAKQGESFELGGTQVKLVSVPARILQGNDASTVVEVLDKKSGRRAIFTGDMTCKRELGLEMLQNYDVLKVGHHGSKGSTSAAFLAQIKPKLAVISCGYKNMYRHPRQATLDRLQAVGSAIARTDKAGCIKVELAEPGIRVQFSRRGSAFKMFLESSPSSSSVY